MWVIVSSLLVISGFGSLVGFDMELEDYVGKGYDVLMVVCDMLFELVGKNLLLICVWYNGFDDSL